MAFLGAYFDPYLAFLEAYRIAACIALNKAAYIRAYPSETYPLAARAFEAYPSEAFVFEQKDFAAVDSPYPYGQIDQVSCT